MSTDPARYMTWDEALQRITGGEAVHAFPQGPDLEHPDHAVPTLCGLDSHKRIVLDLTHPATTPTLRATVTCPGCLEWMHA